MAGRSAKYGGGSGSSSRSGSPPGYPPMPSISSYGSVYDGPGNIPLMGGGPLVPSPYSGLDKQASRKVVNMPPYSSLNNKREAPAYEELINFPRAKDKVCTSCVDWIGKGMVDGLGLDWIESWGFRLDRSTRPLKLTHRSNLNNKPQDEMRCVMCGHPPSDSCVIPRQNKDVCKDCDKATWLHVASVRGDLMWVGSGVGSGVECPSTDGGAESID